MSVTPAPPDILSPEHAVDPYSTYRILLEHYPVLYHAPTNSWLVSRHADLVALFRDKENISSENYSWQLEPVHGKTILQMEGREHTVHRRLLNPFFAGNGLEAFTATILRVAESSPGRSWSVRRPRSPPASGPGARSTSCRASRTSSRSR